MERALVSAIIRRTKSSEELHAEKIAAYWALFLVQNANPAPLEDGSFYLGEVGSEKASRGIERWSPYSVATGLKDAQ